MATYAARAAQFVQYDGTNAAEVLELLGGRKQLKVDQLADTGDVLRLELESYGGPTEGGGRDVVEIGVTDYVRCTEAGDWAAVVPADVFEREWIVKAEA